MDIPQEADDYIRESIEVSLGLPVSENTLRLKLLASEDERHRLQDQIFVLQDQLKECHKRLHHSKEEASMNAQGLKKCIQEKEMVVEQYAEMKTYCSKLEEECMLFERDFKKAMESCDELGKENYELEKENHGLRAQLHDNSYVQGLAAEIKSLQEDKENLRINLQRAEEEVKVLFEDNRLLDEENKRLLRQLQREAQRHGSDQKHSASNSSARMKRKSTVKAGSPFGRHIDFHLVEDQQRQPFSPLLQNSPESRTQPCLL
ncbi:hypothetical protein HPP92_025548 [Vanilla planifolia]|uniref:Uncharacterized protein n=1 Tax=Vanilla planifolia TaxID=51239 RepID=A0A835PM67_VANPL|nr:hypothetical protein HPP92_025845 [Vanilla planifolia]KAG0454244.1 hypothetical protein HPP92_025548 [Vanilla planifolia]